MADFFESNINHLEAYDPDLAMRLRSHNPSGDAEVFKTPSGLLSMRINHKGQTRLLHSGRDPQREAERWAATADCESLYNLCVMGCGLLYHVIEIVKRYQSTLQRIVIIEKNIDVLYSAMTHVDMTSFLQNQNTFFLLDPTKSDIRSLVNRLLTPFTLDGITIIEHPASIAFDSVAYQEIRATLDESLQSGEILLRTKVQLGGMIQENIIRNIPHLQKSASISAFSSIFSGIPAIVVGAGPSLDKNVDQLKHVGDRGVIIVVDTVYNLLLEKGITPHIVVTTDPTYLNAVHFKDGGDLGETVLVYSPTVFHGILPKLNGTKVSMPHLTSRFLPVFPFSANEKVRFSMGTNAGQTCYNLAAFMGCEPIILSGLDFSFPHEGGTTHASGTALRRRITKSETPGKMKVELITETPQLEEFDPILLPGSIEPQVATNKFWLAYLRSMEETISRTELRVINSTEGGAKVEGTELMPLAESIQTFCTQDGMIQSNLQMSVGFFFPSPPDETLDLLKEGKAILETGKQYSEEGLAKLAALQTVLNSKEPHHNTLRDLLAEIKTCHQSLAQEQKVYMILDEAADYLLSPFLKQESRLNDSMDFIDRGNKTIKRYQPYFEGMKELTENYAKIIDETIIRIEQDSSSLF